MLQLLSRVTLAEKTRRRVGAVAMRSAHRGSPGSVPPNARRTSAAGEWREPWDQPWDRRFNACKFAAQAGALHMAEQGKDESEAARTRDIALV